MGSFLANCRYFMMKRWDTLMEVYDINTSLRELVQQKDCHMEKYISNRYSAVSVLSHIYRA
jgi:hypothetical protein